MDLDFSLFYIPRVGTRCSIRIFTKRFAWFWQIPLRSKNFALRANPNVTKFSCSVLTLVLPTQRDVHGKFCYTFTGGQENQQEIIKILKVFFKAKSILNRSDLKFWIIKYLQDTLCSQLVFMATRYKMAGVTIQRFCVLGVKTAGNLKGWEWGWGAGIL